jgi:hypothetical protein
VERLLALWHWLVIGRRPSLRNGMVLASTSTDFDSHKLRGPRLRLSCVLDPRTCTVQIVSGYRCPLLLSCRIRSSAVAAAGAVRPDLPSARREDFSQVLKLPCTKFLEFFVSRAPWLHTHPLREGSTRAGHGDAIRLRATAAPWAAHASAVVPREHATLLP